MLIQLSIQMPAIIDCHTHIGCYEDVTNKNSSWSKVTLEALISYLDGQDVARAVVLPLSSWNVDTVMPTEYALEASRKHPDRLIPFCAVEVREQCFEEKVMRYVDMGCRGFGEHTSKLPIDHKLNQELYRLCGRLEIPILTHLAFGKSETYGAMDTLDLRALEGIVRKYSDVDFIMHGPGWWSGMSSVVPPDESYPKGPIVTSGRTPYILEAYSNVYGDISAGSGYNALNRDPEFARGFVKRLNRQLIYGTDLEGFFEPQDIHVKLLESLELAEGDYENIYHANLERIMK
jgi:predicted TIM-barrel fold metal-dependent hydrolase